VPEPPRREHLLNYLRLIAQDLVARGVVRRANGESIEHLIAEEFRAILGEMQRDVVEVLCELGGKLSLGACVVAEKRGDPTGHIMAGVARALGDFLLGRKRG